MKLLNNFQNQLLADGFVTDVVKTDNQNNLYLLTTNNGIRRIIRNSYAIKYYGTEKRDKNFVVSVCADKKTNRVLAGTQGNGLLIFDTLQRLVKNIRTLPGEKEGFTPTCIIKCNDGSYLLFCWSQKKLWNLDKNLSLLKPLPADNYYGDKFPPIDYYSDFLYQDDTICMVYSSGNIFKIDTRRKNITCSNLPETGMIASLYYEDNFVFSVKDELIFVNPATMVEKKRVPLPNTGGVRCFTRDKENNIYIGTNKGIFKLNDRRDTLTQVDKTKGLPDECIYSMIWDKTGALWCSTNKGIIKINRDESILQLTKEDGLQENEFNTNVCAESEDGELFFGGVNGVNSFFPADIPGANDKINILLTNIKINNRDIFEDSAVWNIRHIDLDYNQNSLSINFIAMGHYSPNQYIYAHKMKGVDHDWIQDNNQPTVRYLLTPGDYVFQVSASRYLNREIKPLNEIYITVHPPYWKTWWFITGISLLVLFIFGYGVNRYNRRQFNEKLRLFEAENKLQLEKERISRDLHDNIGTYANAVIYNTELLEEEDRGLSKANVIQDLRFASREIITSLRETVWALKKNDYSAEDCFLRIRNFIQSISRYYGKIHFKVEGVAPDEKILHYDRALHIVRIVQEAVSNAVRHAGAKNILIISSYENKKWKLQVRDDGKGFNYEEKMKLASGNGLQNMMQRAKEAKVKLGIETTHGSGTVITITG